MLWWLCPIESDEMVGRLIADAEGAAMRVGSQTVRRRDLRVWGICSVVVLSLCVVVSYRDVWSAV